jgi:hypothetical protein
MSKLFFLIDLMNTANNFDVRQYLKLADDYEIVSSSNYYELDNFDLSQFDDRFVCIHLDFMYKLANTHSEYWEDLEKKIENLKKKNFKFILTQNWESYENVKQLQHYYTLLTRLLGTNYLQWYGDYDWFWFNMYMHHKNINYYFDHSKKTHDFFYLNKKTRSHREILFKKLFESGCLKNSIFSYRNDPYKINLEKKYELPGVDNYPIYGKDHIIYEPPYNHSAINLVSETNDNNTEIFMTEKIWKPIIAGQPFIVHGNKHYLKKLKELGFETYGKWFDESYDEISDRNKKIIKIYDSCGEVVKMNYNKFYEDCKNIRIHNQKQFYNIEKLKEIINQRIKNFVES